MMMKNKQWAMLGLLILVVFIMYEPKKEFEDYRQISHYALDTVGASNNIVTIPEAEAHIHVRNGMYYQACAVLPQGVTGTYLYTDDDSCQHWSYSTLEYAEGSYSTSSCYSNSICNTYNDNDDCCTNLPSGWTHAGCYSNYANRCKFGEEVSDFGGLVNVGQFIQDCWYSVEVYDENSTMILDTGWKRKNDGKTVLEYNGFKINFGDSMSYTIPPDSSLYECYFTSIIFHQPTTDQFNVDFIDNYIIVNNNWVDVIVDIEILEGEQIFYSEYGRLVQDDNSEIITIDTSGSQGTLTANVRVAFRSEDFNDLQVYGQPPYDPYLDTLSQVNIFEYIGQIMSPYSIFLEDKDKFLSQQYSIFLFKQQADNWVVP